ncbi:MAG TPA: ABC transporter permease [Capillimicrobium sp.]|nr:ABC transporter permease [Capillimicrobium sp.]
MAVAQVAVAVGLVIAAIALSRATRLGLERDIAVVAIRAIVQLTAVGLVVTVVFEHLGLAAAFVVVMLVAAAFTSGHRLAGIPRARRIAVVAIGAPSLLALGLLLVAGAFPATPRGVIPVAGILIGGAMAAVSLGGRRVRDDLHDRLDEIETRLALGASAHQALHPTLRTAVTTALVPVLDQTRTVGLVALPGTFVGLVLGGASPAEAARVQLTVLLSLIAVELAAALLLARLVTAAWTAPGERVRPPERAVPR